MEVIKTHLKDCLIVKTTKFGDDRGFFLESFNQQKLKLGGIDMDVKQINFAKSQKNVLRGLHFQKEPFAQSKLVGVVSGAVRDVVVDLRQDSPTYLQHLALDLISPDTLLFVPKGFAHGYYTLEENTIFHYAVDQFYNPAEESGVRFNDPTLDISWGSIENAIISQKDLNQPFVENILDN